MKLKRQKRLLTENYELEISELNRRLKSNETEQRFTTSGINIIINSEGQSSRCKDNWCWQVYIAFLSNLISELFFKSYSLIPLFSLAQNNRYILWYFDCWWWRVIQSSSWLIRVIGWGVAWVLQYWWQLWVSRSWGICWDFCLWLF